MKFSAGQGGTAWRIPCPAFEEIAIIGLFHTEIAHDDAVVVAEVQPVRDDRRQPGLDAEEPAARFVGRLPGS